MEIANVDIHKLQLLNERINQTIDALNQVRMSVHEFQTGIPQVQGSLAAQGLSHTSYAPMGYGAVASQWQQPLQWAPQTAPFGVAPVGLSHTSLEASRFLPFGVDPYGAAIRSAF